MIKEFEKDHNEAKRLARNVGKALARLEHLADGEEKLLAVLSVEISGNPHYFDMGNTAAFGLLSLLIKSGATIFIVVIWMRKAWELRNDCDKNMEMRFIYGEWANRTIGHLFPMKH